MMKKLTLLFIVIALSTSFVVAQVVITNSANNTITVDTTGTGLPIVTQASMDTKNSAKQDTTKRVSLWVEAGNGFFTNQPDGPILVEGTAVHPAFLYSTRLYDTNKSEDRGISYLRHAAAPVVGKRGFMSNSFTKYLEGTGVKIIPNVRDIVPGDTMIFAITYKNYPTPKVGDNGSLYEGKYKLFLFYNNNNTFTVESSKKMLGNSSIANFRTHNGETVRFPSMPKAINKDPFNERYSNVVEYEIPATLNEFERTVFATLAPPSTLELGKSGSVYAVLADTTGTIKFGEDVIPNMRFAPSHDPNYLVQRPACLKLNKKAYPFTYTIHFQNTGAGDAKRVRVVANMPKGMNYSSLKIITTQFAGHEPTKFTYTPDSIKRIITFDFVDILYGTHVNDPAINPETMGEVSFVINSTPETDDTLSSYADIYFYSVYPSDKALKNSDKSEDPVKTETSSTVYKKDCLCKDCDILPPPCTNCDSSLLSNCYILLGLCWWWWILIIAFAIITYWLIKRKKQKNNPSS